MPPRGSMPRSSFAIAMKDYTFIRPGIAVSISAAVLVVSLFIGFKLIVDLGHNRAVVEEAGQTVRTLHRYSAAVEVWRQMAAGGDPELQRPEARALRDSIQRALTAELDTLRGTLADTADQRLVGQIVAGFSTRPDLSRDAREAMILLLARQDNAIFAAVEATQRAVLLAAVLLALSVLAAGLLVVPMAWLYIRYKRGAVIDVKLLIAFTLGAGAALAGATPASAQFSTDARRIGMGGLSLDPGPLSRYNAAYGAVPRRDEGGEGPRMTIPIPLGLFQVLKDSTATDFDEPYFNPVALANYILNPPLFLEVKRAPTPTSDVEFTIGRNQLILDLNDAQAIIPADAFGFGSSSRLFEVPIGLPRGFHVGISVFLQYEAGFRLDDRLRSVLTDAVPVQPTTRYGMAFDDQAQFGIAPGLGWSGRVTGTEEQGLYLGAAGRFYMGGAFATMRADAGFLTDTVIFGGANPVRPDVTALVQYSAFDGLGTGVGLDLGAVWVSGPLELGVGVNDLGTTLSWSNVTIERHVYDSVTNDFQKVTIATGADAKTRLPTSYLINARYTLLTGTTVGADLLETGRGTTVHVGGEQAFGPARARAGLARDQRGKIQFGWGGGVRLGPVGLDLGFWTHSRSFSNERGVTMATSLSIY